jgi:hypothetical protein
VLGKHDLTVKDWADVRAVADYTASSFHLGKTQPIRAALANLKHNKVPAEVADKQEDLVKALGFLQSKVKPHRR